MDQQQNLDQSVRVFNFNRPFHEALKSLCYKFQQDTLQVEFSESNKIKVHNWSNGKEQCRKLQQNLNKTADNLTVLKLVQPEKKIERIKMMKSWRKRLQIEGLNIITIKKNYGYSYYLMGLTSHLHLYNILTKLQSHSYKAYTSNFIKFLYKPVLQALITSKDYQIAIYEKLKVTSTQLRVVQVENSNKKKGKFIQFLFELKEYTPTKMIVEKFKEFLADQFFVCGLVIDKQECEQMKRILQEYNNKITAWKIVLRKKQDICYAYLVLKKQEALVNLTEIFLKKHPSRITFLKGMGKSNELLQPILAGNPDKITQNHQILIRNFDIKGNCPKTPNEISLENKNEDEQQSWISSLSLLI